MTYDHTRTQETAQTIEDRVQAVLEESHVGRSNAIKARVLAAGVGEDERTVRAAIQSLRKDGVLILSAISPPYGYFVAETAEEWREFRHQNLRARALDILETDKAMAQAARKRFGSAVQLSLFEKAEVVA